MSARRRLPGLPPHVDMGGDRRAALDRALRTIRVDAVLCSEKRVSREAVLTVLGVLADHASGAGYCWPGIDRIQAHSGWSRPTIFRALEVLRSGHEPLIESWSAPNHDRRRRGLPGHNVYRLGRVIRVAARLYHPDADWESPDRLDASESGSVRLRETTGHTEPDLRRV